MTQTTFDALLQETDEKGRMDCLRALLTEVAERRISVGDGLDSLLATMEQDASPSVQYMIWMLLLRGPASDRVHELGRRTLLDPNAPGRGKAAAYLVQFYPNEHDWLVRNFAKDANPEVAFHVGRALLSRDPDAAVRAWIGCLDETDSLPFWEVVSEYVIAHGNMDHLGEIRKRDAAMGGGSTWNPIAAGIYAAHQVDYPDRPPGPVDHTQPVSWTVCESCRRNIGVRQGREGERIRCLYCGHTFLLHLDPSMSPR